MLPVRNRSANLNLGFVVFTLKSKEEALMNRFLMTIAVLALFAAVAFILAVCLPSPHAIKVSRIASGVR